MSDSEGFVAPVAGALCVVEAIFYPVYMKQSETTLSQVLCVVCDDSTSLLFASCCSFAEDIHWIFYIFLWRCAMLLKGRSFLVSQCRKGREPFLKRGNIKSPDDTCKSCSKLKPFFSKNPISEKEEKSTLE